MIDPDADAKLDRSIRNELMRRLGREPTAEDLQTYYDERDQRYRAQEEEAGERERRAADERQRLVRERQAVLDIRRRHRSIAPTGFTGNTSAEELQRRSSRNEANCQQAVFNFDGATFRWVVFSEDANLNESSFINADFEHVIFEPGCQVKNADFGGARFDKVTFEPGCLIEGSSFHLARFEKGVVINFDHNNLTGAAFSGTRTDRWHQLSKTYSTIAQVLNAILSMTYFALLLIKLYIFKAMVTLQQLAIERSPPRLVKVDHFSQVTVYDFVFGSQWTSLALAVLIIAYQASRLFLTMRIAPLIEVERQSGYTPALIDFVGLRTMQIVTLVLGWVALLAFIYELQGLLDQDALLLPRSLARP